MRSCCHSSCKISSTSCCFMQAGWMASAEGSSATSSTQAPSPSVVVPKPPASKLNASAVVFVPRTIPPLTPSLNVPPQQLGQSNPPPPSSSLIPPPASSSIASSPKPKGKTKPSKWLKLAMRMQTARVAESKEKAISSSSDASKAISAPAKRSWVSIVTAPPKPKPSPPVVVPLPPPTTPATPPTLASIVAAPKGSSPKGAPSPDAEPSALPKEKRQSSNKPSKAPLSLAAVIARQMEQAAPATVLDQAVVSYAKQKQAHMKAPAHSEVVKKKGLVRNPNLADTSAPVIFRRGRERETPKPKKPSRVKKLVLLERLRRANNIKGTVEEGDDKRAMVVDGGGQQSKGDSAVKEVESKQSEDQLDDKITSLNDKKQEEGSEGQMKGGGAPAAMPTSILPKGPTPRLTNEVREYCDHALTPELDAAATELLTELKRFHDRAIAKDPSKAKRRFVSGLREVLREVKAKSARSVIIAPNIEECKAEGGLDETLSEIIRSARSGQIPVVFALSRNKLGRVLGKHVRISAVAILIFDGAQDKHKRVLDLARTGREERKKQLREAAKAEKASEPSSKNEKKELTGESQQQTTESSSLAVTPPSANI